jgi:mRNA interferase MazF
MAMVVKRFDVYLMNLDPTSGTETQTARPYLIISPDEMNRHIKAVIGAPVTSADKDYPTRVPCTFKKRNGQIVLDQIRTFEKSRLIKKLGTIDVKAQVEVISALQRLFAY